MMESGCVEQLTRQRLLGKIVMNVPQILLDVLPHCLPLLPDEIRNIQQPILFLLLTAMSFNDRARHNANPAFFS